MPTHKDLPPEPEPKRSMPTAAHRGEDARNIMLAIGVMGTLLFGLLVPPLGGVFFIFTIVVLILKSAAGDS